MGVRKTVESYEEAREVLRSQAWDALTRAYDLYLFWQSTYAGEKGGDEATFADWVDNEAEGLRIHRLVREEESAKADNGAAREVKSGSNFDDSEEARARTGRG